MAQWTGQFSGNTHETRLAEAECSLRLAVKSWMGASPKNRPLQLAKATRLAAKVLKFRKKAAEARLNALRDRPVKAEGSRGNANQMAALQGAISQLEAVDVQTVLLEFGIEP